MNTARWIAAPLALTGALSAQTPDGHVVVSSFNSPVTGNDGAIFWVHPSQPTAVVSPSQVVQGLGADLTGAGSVDTLGASCVAVRRTDRALIVGETGPDLTTIDLHVIDLVGNVVTQDVRFALGTAQSSPVVQGQVPDCAVLPDGRILVGVCNLIAPGPLAGAHLGVVDDQAGTVTPLPMAPNPTGTLQALALDRTGSEVWFGMVDTVAPPHSTIYRVPVTGGAPTPVVTFPARVSGLAVHDVEGGPTRVIASTLGTVGQSLLSIDPDTATATAVLHGQGELVSVAVERATGEWLVVTGGGSGTPGRLFRVTPGGQATPLTFTALGELGAKSGVGLDPNPETYGDATPGTSSYGWVPDLGGRPEVGNASFVLRLRASPVASPGLLILGLARAEAAVNGVTLLVAPFTTLSLPPFPGDLVIPAGVPAQAALVGASVTLQSVHFDPGGLAASDGLELTVL